MANQRANCKFLCEIEGLKVPQARLYIILYLPDRLEIVDREVDH